MSESEASPETRYRGVYRTSWGNMWFGQFRHQGKLRYMGTFKDASHASEAVESERIRLNGLVTTLPETP